VESDAGAFAIVMATGIVSVAAFTQGLDLLSAALLAVACAGWVALAAVLSWPPRRRWRRRPSLRSFALVAATAVIGARFALSGQGAIALGLWSLALVVWLLLWIRRPVIDGFMGSSLLVVVATESLAVLAALLAPRWSAALLVVALVAWILGLVLYPFVLGAIVFALSRKPRHAPDLWIVMGALAIATLAGTELRFAVRTVHTLPWLSGSADVDLVTWALASSLIVPLVALELNARQRWRYEATRWAFVFPLGMYAVASHALGRAEGWPLLGDVGGAFFIVAVAAWALAAIGLARRLQAELMPRSDRTVRSSELR